jgi:predicted TIM-barrel fold metal-dependent hydrolase
MALVLTRQITVDRVLASNLERNPKMIIDCHAHVFPYLGGASGFDSAETHLMHWQQEIGRNPAAAVRRVKDGALVEDHRLWRIWDETASGPGGFLDVNFRVGKFGRFEWTKDGVDYYVHVYAPSLQDMTGPPELMVAQMDWAGVDMAVLQNPWLYGRLNDYFADAAKKYPNRLIGQIQVNEAQAHEDSQIAELRRAVTELGLTGGLYYTNKRYWEKGYKDHIDDEKYFPFWEEVRSLDIPVFWDLGAISDPEHPNKSGLERYLDQMRRFDNWLGRFPDIPCVLVHGILLTVFGVKDDVVVPDEIWELWSKPNVYVEILFPIQSSYPRPGASQWDYPYPQTRPIIKQLYEKLGPEKLMWGSDMPNVERNCTYRQSLDYLVRHCDFITPSHMDLIIGGNVARLLKLES